MKSPLSRLFIYGIFGLGISTAIIAENYVSKRNTLWEYIIAIVLAVFSVVFLIGRYIIIRKNK